MVYNHDRYTFTRKQRHFAFVTATLHAAPL